MQQGNRYVCSMYAVCMLHVCGMYAVCMYAVCMQHVCGMYGAYMLYACSIYTVYMLNIKVTCMHAAYIHCFKYTEVKKRLILIPEVDFLFKIV